MRIRPADRVVFVLSTALLAFFYGYGAGTFGFFPADFLDRTTAQIARYSTQPEYLAPKIYDSAGVSAPRPTKVQPGMTLIATHSAAWDWETGLLLLDMAGNIVHEWSIDPEDLFPDASAGEFIGSIRGVKPVKDRGIHGSFLFPNGDVLVNIEYLGTARLDACGEPIWSVRNGAHHSIARADDGSFWIPTAGSASMASSRRFPDGYPGLDRPVNHERAVRMSEDGEVLQSISLFDVLFDNDMQRYLLKTRPASPTDLLHVNDVEPLPHDLADDYPLFEPGDLLVSIRAADLVLVMDPETEIVKWATSDPFVQQHDPDFIGDGWIGVFNNNREWDDSASMLGGSELVAVKPSSDSSRVLYPKSDSSSFYSPILGKWQALANGNVLVTEGRTGRVFEAGPRGRMVWQWVHEPYDADRTVEVTEGTRYSLDRGHVATWPCPGPRRGRMQNA